MLAACGGGEGAPTTGVTANPTPTGTGTPSLVQTPGILPSLTATATPSRTAVASSTATAQPSINEPFSSDIDSAALVKAALEYLTGPDEINDSFIRRMGESGDTSFVPVLLDLLFFRFFNLRTPIDPIRSALTKLTGEDFADPGWQEWFIWLGRHPEVEATPGYAEWKSQLFQRIDPRISMFFYNGVKARFRLEEIVWGGVRRDGIPDLTDAPVIPASQATYLNPDDRVFGVSINGEHRAYPLRILNAHEMANDVVGGEPIALAY